MTHHDQLTVRDIHGPYRQLLTNLQGEAGPEWLFALNKFLAKENPWPKRAHEYEPWKTLQLGHHPSLDSYQRAFKDKKIREQINYELLLDVLSIGMSRKTVEVVKLTVASLGIKAPCSCAKVIERAVALGFKLPNVEIAFALRLAYLEQPEGEVLYLPLKPASMIDGESVTFRLDHQPGDDEFLHPNEFEGRKRKSQLWLDTSVEYKHSNCQTTNKFVFVKSCS